MPNAEPVLADSHALLGLAELTPGIEVAAAERLADFHRDPDSTVTVVW